MESGLGASLSFTEKYSNRSLFQAQLFAKLVCQKSFILRWYEVRVVRKQEESWRFRCYLRRIVEFQVVSSGDGRSSFC